MDCDSPKLLMNLHKIPGIWSFSLCLIASRDGELTSHQGSLVYVGKALTFSQTWLQLYEVLSPQ